MKNRLLSLFLNIALKNRKLVLWSTIIITLLAFFATSLIKIDMRWSALLPESMPIVKEFNKIDKNYLQPGNMIIAISGRDSDTLEKISDEVEYILNEKLKCSSDMSIAEIKKSKKYAKQIYGKLPEEWLSKHLLSLAKPKDVKRLSKIYSDISLTGYLKNLNDDFEDEYSDGDNVKNQENQVVRYLDGIEKLIIALYEDRNIDSSEKIKKIVRNLTSGNPYMISPDNSMSLIMVASAIPSDDFEVMPLLDKEIERLLKPLAAKYPQYKIERTGMTAVGRDEMDSIGPYTQMITLLALVLIFIALTWFFRSKFIPILTLIPIVIGIVWTTGFIGITLGEMNLMTMMIMVVLLGLGIDFSIHITSRFNEEILAGNSLEESMKLALLETGTGVVTGAITTAIAFFALMIANTKGIHQFGYCAGSGILIAIIAVFWIQPSILIYNMNKRAKKGKLPNKKHDFFILENGAILMSRKRWFVVVVVLVVALLGFYGGTHVKWEYNFLNLEPKGLRSVILQDEIIEKYKMSSTTSFLTVKDVATSRELKEKFKRKSVIADVSDISDWLSRDDYEKNIPYINSIKSSSHKNQSPSLYNSENQKKILTEELFRLWANIVEIRDLSFIGGQERVVAKCKQLVADREHQRDGLLWKLNEKTKDKSFDWKRLNKFSSIFTRELKSKIQTMTADNKKVTEDMIPIKFLEQFKNSKLSGYLMYIFPKENLFNKSKLVKFTKAVKRVDKRVTGMPQMILSMSSETIKEGRNAVILSIILIMLILLIDFKRPLLAILTFLPLMISLSLTLGVMYLLKQKLNYINLIALPVIIGIGIDDGVHYFHRLLIEGPGGIKKTVHSVGQAMMMTSITTMIGFGSLMFYLMRGMASMGLVLFLGVGFCFLVTITLLPALSKIFEKQIFKGVKNEKN